MVTLQMVPVLWCMYSLTSERHCLPPLWLDTKPLRATVFLILLLCYQTRHKEMSERVSQTQDTRTKKRKTRKYLQCLRLDLRNVHSVQTNLGIFLSYGRCFMGIGMGMDIVVVIYQVEDDGPDQHHGRTIEPGGDAGCTRPSSADPP